MTELTPPSDLAAAVVEMKRWRPTAEDVRPVLSRFKVLPLDDIELGDEPLWAIDQLMPATGFGIVFGLPKSGKSFLLSDALFHVAMGRPWAGKAVKQGAVVYITAEGVSGFKRRLVTMRRHYGVERQGIPFGIITVAPDFGHTSGDAEALIKEIRAYLETLGNPPLAAVAIDTLARAMRGADENTAKDMGTFTDNCGLIAEAFECIVLGVHHAGKDLSRGSRGSNALDGAVDVMWSVEKGEVSSTVAIHHMKDGEEGLSWQFRLSPFVLAEATAAKSATTSCIVEIVSEPALAQPAQQKRSQKLGDGPELLLDIIREAVSDAGTYVKGDVNVPHDHKSLTREKLKRYLPIKGYWDADRADNAKRAVFSKDLKTLKVRGYIGLTADHVWLLEK